MKTPEEIIAEAEDMANTLDRMFITSTPIRQLLAMCRKRGEALEHYAKRDMRRQEVVDSVSGEVSMFDWDGSLADEPWEFADRGLVFTGEGGEG